MFSVDSNLVVFLMKWMAYVYTGSAAMLSETIHSLVDMLNQVCLLYVRMYVLLTACMYYICMYACMHLFMCVYCMCIYERTVSMCHLCTYIHIQIIRISYTCVCTYVYYMCKWYLSVYLCIYSMYICEYIICMYVSTTRMYINMRLFICMYTYECLMSSNRSRTRER